MQWIDEAVTQLLDLMPNECQKHWMRLDTYLTFILDLAKSHPYMLQMLACKKTVTRLIDLMSKYNPTSLVYSQANPPLESLVLAINFIVRSIPCLVDPADLDDMEELDISTKIMMLTSERGASRFYKPISKSFSMLELSQEEQTLTLPEECLRNLFMHQKSNKLFYNNTSERGFVREEYAKMVAHLCYANKEFSRKIAKHILKGTNKSTAEEIGPFLELMKQFLTVNDEYFDIRMEWIFGVADFCVKNASYTIYNSLPKVGIANADNIGS